MVNMAQKSARRRDVSSMDLYIFSFGHTHLVVLSFTSKTVPRGGGVGVKELGLCRS